VRTLVVMDGERPGRPPEDRLDPVLREAAIVAVVAVVHLGLTTGAARNQPEAPLPLWPWGYALLAATALILPLRHRYPVATAAGVFALTLAYWSAGFPGGPVFLALIITLFGLVSRGHRRAAILMITAGYVSFPWLGYLFGQAEPPQPMFLVGLAAWLVALVSIAEALRYRRERAREVERSRLEAARRQAGEERLRIARDVHDTVAHAMSLITIQAGVALHRGGELPPETREALTVIRSTSREALTELRAILGVLRDAEGAAAPRTPTPGLSRLDELMTWAGQVGLDVRLNVADLPEELPGRVDTAAYRILQEALTNAARHAGRCRVSVDVGMTDGAVALAVVDDGVGIPVAASVGGAPAGGARAGGARLGAVNGRPGGNGIVGMRERAAALGGSLSAGPEPGGGWAVRARLPVEGGA
jgi:signal transduction histidine kinase